jgi:GNAT superfamily N-acetyltransferase
LNAHPLDNPVWSSAVSAHVRLARFAPTERPLAVRYLPDVSPFGGLRDPLDPKSWAALDEILEGAGVVVLVDPGDVPSDWEVLRVIPGVQMEGSRLEGTPDPQLARLGESEVSDMMDLVTRTRPGPFLPRTVEMGTYLGLWRQNSLIAMAGERLRPTGWSEISAVCTDADFRGQGIGSRCVRAVAAGIFDREERPFLHAAATNTGAIDLYRSLGFELRRTVSFTVVRKERSP